MKYGILGIILLISLFFTCYGLIKNKKSVRQWGYAGMLFIIIVAISDFIMNLNL